MAVASDGEVVGSVSGGCVEGAVHEVALEVIASGRPQLVTYGVSDDDAFAVGLTCGGVLEVFVHRYDTPMHEVTDGLAEAVLAERACALVTVVAGEGLLGAQMVVEPGAPDAASGPARLLGSLGDAHLDDAVRNDAVGMLANGITGVLHIGSQGERRHDELTLFVESYVPPPRMYVFGAIDFAAAVVRIGKYLGFRVTVCDARPIFATPARFPEADEVVVDWPHRWLAKAPVDERTVMCVLTHDPKFDVPLLQLALRTPAAYIGAMGSRRTHEGRLEALREAGLGADVLSRLASPVGLDLGGRTPEETAVSIAAEIIALRWGGSGRRLSEVQGTIHHERDHAAASSAAKRS